MPRRTWLDSKIDVFLEELAGSGMHLDRQRAGEVITEQVRGLADLMRVTEAAARSYLGNEVIKDMARRMLFEVAGERPGADLMEAPRTVPLSLALVGSPSRRWQRQWWVGQMWASTASSMSRPARRSAVTARPWSR